MKKLIFIFSILCSFLASAQADFPEGIVLPNATKKNDATRIVVQDSITKEYHWKLQSSLVSPTNISIGNRTATTLDVLSSTGTGFTFPSVSASEAGLLSATKFLEYNAKISGSGTTNFIPKFTASGTIGNSSLRDETNNYIFGKPIFRGISGTGNPASPFYEKFIFNGLEATAEASIQFGNAFNTNNQTFIRFTTNNSTANVVNNNLTLKGDGTSEFGGAITATTYTGSATLTGVSTAPTATAGTNTTQIATTAFVTNAVTTADSGNVKLTGDQNIGGIKDFTGILTRAPYIELKTNLGSFAPSINNVLIGTNGTFFSFKSRLTNAVTLAGTGLSVNRVFTFTDQSGTLALTDSPVNISTPNATLNTHLITKGQNINNSVNVTANTTITLSQYTNNNKLVLYCDTTAGNITVTLPAFATFLGYEIVVKKTDASANSVIIQGNANIDSASTFIVSGQNSKVTITASSTKYETI